MQIISKQSRLNMKNMTKSSATGLYKLRRLPTGGLKLQIWDPKHLPIQITSRNQSQSPRKIINLRLSTYKDQGKVSQK